MRIEKINDKQIRCTLDENDLTSREIKLSELAYGTEKAKALFQDIMQQAKTDYGFDPENSPIMVEAIPVSPASLILVISKVDDPEEMDSRFSRFSEEPMNDKPKVPEKEFTGADDILELFKKICDTKEMIDTVKKEAEEKKAASREAGEKTADSGLSGKTKDAKTKEEIPADLHLIQLFQFSSLDGVIAAAPGLKGVYDDKNSLYKDPLTGDYLLVLNQGLCSPENFNRASNILSEYSQVCLFGQSGVAFLNEHADCIIRDNAVQTLSELH